MESRAKLLGHAMHPILIVFPLGLLATGVIFDFVYTFTRNTTFSDVSFYMILSGVIGGLIAAVPGWIDWFAIKSGTRAKSVGLLHGGGNVLVLVLFAVSLYLRTGDPDGHEPSLAAFALAILGALLSLGTGWLGGELVERLGIGVDDGAYWNAPNSLSSRPASDNAAEN